MFYFLWEKEEWVRDIFAFASSTLKQNSNYCVMCRIFI